MLTNFLRFFINFILTCLERCPTKKICHQHHGQVYEMPSIIFICILFSLQEMSLIRFHPGSEEEEVAYVSLFSYFNSRRRFGVVSNICKHIKDLYLIPLCAKQAIPSVLLPIEGPGK